MLPPGYRSSVFGTGQVRYEVQWKPRYGLTWQSWASLPSKLPEQDDGKHEAVEDAQSRKTKTGDAIDASSETKFFEAPHGEGVPVTKQKQPVESSVTEVVKDERHQELTQNGDGASLGNGRKPEAQWSSVLSGLRLVPERFTSTVCCT